MPQNFSAYTQVKTVEGAEQVIAQGPVASQEIIKELGTNGGGFFNANSAHPFENPTPLTNLLEMVAIFAIGAGLTHTFGQMAGDQRQGWALFARDGVLFLMGVTPAIWAEQRGNPQFAALGLDQHATASQTGGNMEGKEVRFGIVELGAVGDRHHRHLVRRGQLDARQLHAAGRPGPAGQYPARRDHLRRRRRGLYGMLVLVVLSVFIAGLMVGRTPEYLGKKIEGREMKLAMLFILIFPAVILLPAGDRGRDQGRTGGHQQRRPARLLANSLCLYRAAANNGSAFGGLNANTPSTTSTLAFVMLFGRFMMMVPVLALAGSLAGKKTVPPSAGTFPTNGAIFVVLLVGVILIVAALTFFPADALGPIVEHLAMMQGKLLLGARSGISDDSERKAAALWDSQIVKRALVDSLRKFDPRIQARTRSCSWSR